MENILFKGVSFSYPTSEYPVLNDVSFTVNEGELCLVIGKSGVGKSTILKMLKKEIAPAGSLEGTISVKGSVGYVSQNVEENIVCDKVRSELSFGLTNLGMDRDKIELLVAETAGYFNISSKLDNDISTLSGGEKQILNLASVMIMKPEILVLDEPTCQLDPVSAKRFVSVIKDLHRDFGTTIVLAEHLLEEIYPYANSVILVDSGKVVAKLPPFEMISYLKKNDEAMLKSIPLFMRLFDEAKTTAHCRRILKEKNISSLNITEEKCDTILKVKNLSFAYKKNNDVLKSLNLKVYDRKINIILGANSSGKSTLLKTIAGVLKQHHGKVKTDKTISMLCQNPFDLFTQDKCSDEVSFGDITAFLEIDDIKNQHPFDISGGQAQRLALAKVLSTGADIILLDEPTKALDTAFKNKLGEKLKKLCSQGKTIVIATHDVDFAGEFGDYISFLSNGEIISTKPKNSFFSDLNYYTTTVARITSGIADGYCCESDLDNGGVL